MNSYFLSKYFFLTNNLLYKFAAFPEKKTFNSKLMTFVYNRVYPVAFFLFWVPLMLMTVAKAFQFANQKKWDKFLEVMHMYFLGTNTMYIIIAVQKTAVHYNNCMNVVKEKFLASNRVSFNNMKLYVGFWVTFVLCYVFKAVSCVIYKELSFQVWVPFVDNDKELPTHVFIVTAIYQLLAATYLMLLNGFLSPFVVVITSVIVEEIQYIVQQLELFDYIPEATHTRTYVKETNHASGLFLQSVRRGNKSVKFLKAKTHNDYLDFKQGMPIVCTTENGCKKFIRDFVEHHLIIKKLILEVSKIHKYVFLTQCIFTVSHSCFLAYNVYYTRDHTKILLKYSPYLLLSYYLLYLFCYNGQRLSDVSGDLFHSLYRCPWYKCPRSVCISLMIAMSATLRPAKLSGGGLIAASLATFLNGVQQSVSYLLILNQLTPDKKFL